MFPPRRLRRALQFRALQRENEALRRQADEHHRIDATFRQHQSLLNYIIANLPHSIFWKDWDGRFLGGNANFLRDMRMPLDQLVGKNDSDLGFPLEQVEFFRRCDLEVMESGVPLLEIEEAQQQADGTHILLTSKVPLRDPNGKITGLLGIYVDITDRKRIESELARACNAAEAAARAKSEFLTVMSHELRTPLTLILGPLESLLSGASGPLPEGIIGDLERIQRNAARLYLLVSDVLDVSKIEAGLMQVSIEPLAVPELVSHILEDARGTATSKQIRLELNAAPIPAFVPLDRRKLERILLNLVGNALKFTPVGGQITVGLEVKDDRLELSVTDTGPGIPADKQGMLFQRFQQIDGSSTRQYEGTGIGLALVRELAELMGGEAGVQSELGRGSRFFVRLPLDNLVNDAHRGDQGLEPDTGAGPLVSHAQRLTPPRHEAGSRPPRLFSRDSGRPVVLIVEDNADMRGYICDILSSQYDLEIAENGLEALAAVERRLPDVIVSDIMMPGLDGLELVARLKADPRVKQVPVILLTARATREEIVNGLNAGADDYLSKPFGRAELQARIQAGLRLHGTWQELEARRRELQATLEKLRETQVELVHAAKMSAVGTMVAGLSHELNNPLGVILMNAQRLLKRNPEDYPFRNLLVGIEKQALRCSQLIRALLNLAYKRPSLREQVGIGTVLDRVLELVHAQERVQEVVRLPDEGASPIPELNICVQEIESALLNIFSNALDATPSGGRVTLLVRAQTVHELEGVEISVTDNGHGIAPEMLPRIFDPFFTMKPAGSGTGLGLSLTRQIVEAHDGQIGVESVNLEGTTVRIWLPGCNAAMPLPEVGI